MPYIFVSQPVFDEIERRRVALQTTPEKVVLAALEHTTAESLARYHRERFYVISDADARWLLDQRAREGTRDDL